jgi:zinc protease
MIYEDIEAEMADVALKEDDILGGFKAFYTELERMKRFGFSDDEVNRAKTNILNICENAVKKAPTRKNPEFVRPILSHFFDNEPFMEPETELQIVQQLLANINAQVLSMLTPQLMAENLVIIYSGPEKAGIATPTEKQILDAIAEVKASEIKPMEGEEIASEFLNPALLKGAAVKKTGKTIYDATEWTLKNGVKVIVLPTEYTKDQILFNISKEGGASLISDADIASFDDNIWGLWMNNAGVSGFTGTQVSKMLTGKTLSVTPYIDRLEHGIGGSSSVKDLETALQLVYLFYTDPRFDQDEYDNGINQITAVLPNLENQPNYKLQKELYKTLYKTPRREMISAEKLAKASLATIEKNYRSLFADAAGATMVIVGDVDLNALKPLVEKYIGSLPKGKKATKWVDTHEDIIPGRIENVFTVDMQTPMSTVVQAWTAPLAYTAERQAALEAITYILDIRYTNSLREDEGGTYGASSQGMIQRRPTEQVIIQVVFACRPSLCDKLRSLAIEGIRDLAANGPTDDEVNSAVLNLKKNLPESRVSNSYWRGRIKDYLDYGKDGDAAREAALNSLTKDSIQKFLQEILAADNLAEIVMKPANTAESE